MRHRHPSFHSSDAEVLPLHDYNLLAATMIEAIELVIVSQGIVGFSVWHKSLSRFTNLKDLSWLIYSLTDLFIHLFTDFQGLEYGWSFSLNCQRPSKTIETQFTKRNRSASNLVLYWSNLGEIWDGKKKEKRSQMSLGGTFFFSFLHNSITGNGGTEWQFQTLSLFTI